LEKDIMLSLSLDEIIAAWQLAKERTYHAPGQRALELTLIRSLAKGKPISPERLAEVAELPIEVAREIFKSLQNLGADFDSSGRLTGMVLTLRPTPHEFHLNGLDLFAWCALDTLFLPALIGQTAEVASTCPVTGEEIRLTVRPDGIESAEPENVVLSIVVPGHSAACNPGLKGGAQGAVCSSMHFFRDRQAASTWLVGQPDVAVLTLQEAWNLASQVWIERFKTASSKV
jgi:alkylmercury lyase